MNHSLIVTPLLLLLAGSIQTFGEESVKIDFNESTDYETQFVAMPAKGEVSLAHSQFDGGIGLRKGGLGTVSVLYDTSAQGGLGGSAGQVGEAACADYRNVEVAVNARFVDFNTGSVGLWSRVGVDNSSGYLGLVNVISGNQVRLRIFGEGSSPMNITPGLCLQDVTLAPLEALSTNQLYRIVMTTKETDTGVHLELSLSDLVIGEKYVTTEVEVSPSTEPASGQVGFRASSKTLILDDFSVLEL